MECDTSPNIAFTHPGMPLGPSEDLRGSRIKRTTLHWLNIRPGGLIAALDRSADIASEGS